MSTSYAHGRIWIWISFILALILQTAPWAGTV